MFYFRYQDKTLAQQMYDLERSKYDRDSLEAAHELMKLQRDTRKRLADVKVPALIIQSGADKTIDPSSGQFVYDRISSADKQLEVIAGAEHVITCHPTRNIAYPFVLSFVKRLAN